MRISVPALLSLSLLLAACGKAPQSPTSAPAASTAAAASTAPAATSAAAASTSEVATVSTIPVPQAVTTTGPEIAGSVALAQGSVTDTAKDGGSRQLKDGDNVYPGDSFVLGSESYLDLDLEDTGRILLRPNTSFQIQSYHYDADAHEPVDASGQPLIKPASAQPENAFFKLIKGGLRAVDGVIGKTNPQNYGVETPVATIGVRGTAFDVRYCGDDCTDEADAGGKPDNGLYTSVSDGTVDVKNDDGDVVTPAGHSGYVKSRKQRMQALAAPPKALRHMDLPEKLKPRSQKNRGNIQVRRQKRRQMIKQRRQAAQKAKAAGKPGSRAKGAKPETPAERGQERQKKPKEQRKGGATSGGQGKPEAAPGRGEKRRDERRGKQETPANAKQEAGAGKAREHVKEKRQQRRDERQQGKPADAAPQDKQSTKGDDEKCKGKKKRRKNGKCGD
jgi:FecR-like protein